MTAFATLRDHIALKGVTLREASSMPNVRTRLTLMLFVDLQLFDTENNIGFWKWDAFK